mgnify:FL=1
MRRRTALGVLGGSISAALGGCLATASDDDQETEETDPYADLDVVEEIEVDGWQLSAEIYPTESTSVWDSDREELVDVEPTEELFIESWVRITNLTDEDRIAPFAETLNSIEILVDGEPVEPIEELPGGYGWDEQRVDSGQEIAPDPAYADSRVRAGSYDLSILVYDLPDGEVVVDTRSVESVDAVLAPDRFVY